MRILRLVPYMYLNDRPAFQRNNNGFGRSVWDISRYCAALGEEVSVFTYVPTEAFSLAGVSFMGLDLSRVISHVRPYDCPEALRILRSYSSDSRGIVAKMKYVLKQCTKGYLADQIGQGKFDVIHVHGVTLDTVPLLDAAIEADVPMVVTMHGMYSLGAPSVTWFNPVLEKLLVEYLNYQGICITTVSSGIRDTIIDRFDIGKPERIKVVLNGVECDNFKSSESKEILRKQYELSSEKTLLLTVGSLTRVKNQHLVLEGLLRVPQEIRERLHYLIVGDGPEENYLQELASHNRLTCVQFLGYRDGKELTDIYNLADAFIFTSPAIGYPRMFLESFSAGTPVLAFSDLAGLNDVYSSEAMELIRGRSAQAVSDAILRAISTKWDREAIRRHAQNFSWSQIAKGYRAVYENEIALKECRRQERQQEAYKNITEYLLHRAACVSESERET